MEGPATALQLLGSKDRTHLSVNVEESDPVGGQLQQVPEVFLEVDHCLLQTEADSLHPLTTANIHHSAAGAQVHLCQRGQLTILGYKDVVPGRKQGSCQDLNLQTTGGWEEQYKGVDDDWWWRIFSDLNIFETKSSAVDTQQT